MMIVVCLLWMMQTMGSAHSAILWPSIQSATAGKQVAAFWRGAPLARAGCAPNLHPQPHPKYESNPHPPLQQESSRKALRLH